MDELSRLKLKDLVSEYKPEETTEKIRQLKHSYKIKNDVEEIILTKRKYKNLKKETLHQMCRTRASFLFENYTNIFNKVVKGEINLEILGRLIMVLKKIEDGLCDQHEASVLVGSILKELYVDSALKEDERRNRNEKKKKKEKKRKSKNISWLEFKKTL
tara:strand:+ start:119 stop:595 length:477 start_codon:yes stop_codon:yes gene_type:complete